MPQARVSTPQQQRGTSRLPPGVRMRGEGLVFSLLLPAGSLATDGACLSEGFMSLFSFLPKTEGMDGEREKNTREKFPTGSQTGKPAGGELTSLIIKKPQLLPSLWCLLIKCLQWQGGSFTCAEGRHW